MENKNLMPEMSDQFDVVLGQLMKAKQEMGSAVKKDATNPFHKSKYASLGAHLDLCEDVLFKHGLLLMHTTNFMNDVPVLIASLHHPVSKQWMKSYLPLPNPKNDSQGVGASVTYMRRYSINSMLGLTAEDDDGETASGRGQYAKKEAQAAEKKPTNSNKISTSQLEKLRYLEGQLDSNCKQKINVWLEKKHKITDYCDISLDIYPDAVSALENAVKYLHGQKFEVGAVA